MILAGQNYNKKINGSIMVSFFGSNISKSNVLVRL